MEAYEIACQEIMKQKNDGSLLSHARGTSKKQGRLKCNDSYKLADLSVTWENIFGLKSHTMVTGAMI